MSNKGSSHQHGCHRIKRLQPTKIQSKKRNKANNQAGQKDRQEQIQIALAT